MTKRSFLLHLLAVVATLGAQLPHPSSSHAQQATVKIDDIKQDQAITGKLSNINNPQNYKVLVYVKTDKWYIHPYADQGENMSWAAIDEKGMWSIPTEKRKFTASSIAVLVVDASVAQKAPGQLTNIRQIKTHAMAVYSEDEMKQNKWHGKL